MSSDSEEWTSFINVMNFEVKMRAIWLPENPPIKIQPGQVIDGPPEVLSTYRFLQPVPIKMHEVSSVITQQNGDMQDVGENVNEVFTVKETDVVTIPTETLQVSKTVTKDQLREVGIDIDEKVNWMKFKTDDLEDICVKLELDTSACDDSTKNKKKWDLVKLIKESVA